LNIQLDCQLIKEFSLMLYILPVSTWCTIICSPLVLRISFFQRFCALVKSIALQDFDRGLHCRLYWRFCPNLVAADDHLLQPFFYRMISNVQFWLELTMDKRSIIT
jgi:hypothetical protein